MTTGLIRRLKHALAQRPVGRRLISASFWTLLGSIVSRALTIPVSVLLARLMGSAHFGELGVIYSSTDLFTVFAGFGLGLTATKHVAELRSKDPARTGRILSLSIVSAAGTGTLVAAVMYVSAPWLAAHTLAAPHLSGPLRIASTLLFFAAINGAQSGALYGFESFRTMARLQTIVGVINVPVVLIGYWLGDLDGILWALVAIRILDWYLKRRALNAEMRQAGIELSYSGCLAEHPILWNFSVPALIGSALVAPINWACSAILVNQPGGYAQMGIYSAANQWYNALLFLPLVLGTGLLPLLANRMGDGDSHRSSKVLRFMVALNAVIVLPAVLLIALFSKSLMHMYGPGFANAWPTLVVVAITAGIFSLLAPVGDVITASGKMWIGCAMNAGWAACFVGCTYALVHAGAFGLASARCLAYGIHALWTAMFALYLIRKQQPSRTDLQITDPHFQPQQ